MRILLSCLLILNIGSGFAQNLEFRSVTTYPSEMSDVWGYSDGEKEYALATYEDGFSVVDVTDPDNPVVLHDVPGPNTYWRDVKTYGNYAYGVHEDEGIGSQGLVIMDLSQLPEALPVTFWTTDGDPDINFRAAHNIFIDENGIVYLIGHNMPSGGVLMLDVSASPTNPTVVGQYTDHYVHDCYARNDTLWTAEVGAGQFSVIDIRSKANPRVLARQTTPLAFTHNIWVSDDGRTAFTTDERTGAYLASYDVSDIHDIQELDRYRSGGSVIPHNAFVKDEFVIISWYSHGIIIVDATFPDELVEVGRFDTAPNYPGPGFHGAWGVYPYLPSGNILVTDIEEGLVVLSPEYKNATHLRGVVKNSETGDLISGAMVEITGPNESINQTTDLSGGFKEGQVEGGTFSISVSKNGYQAASIEVSLAEGEVAHIIVELDPIVYTPTDTIFIEVIEGEAVEICDENTNGIEVDNAFICNGQTGSVYGSWTVDNSGCLTYNAADDAGDQTDFICMVVQAIDSDEFNVNIIVVDILNSPTGIENNLFSGGLSLLQNPVQDELLIKNDITSTEKLIFKIFDNHGRLLSSNVFSGAGENIRIPSDHLSSGLYILSVAGGSDSHGYIKFVKQ